MKNLTPILLAALLAAGCSTKGENSVLVITKVLQAKGTVTTTTGGATTVTCSPISAGDDEPSFILIGPDNFGQVGLVVDNRLATNAGGLRTNTNDFLSHQVVASYEVTSGGTLSNAPSTVPASGVVEANSAGPVIVSLFPSNFGVAAGVIAAGSFIRATLHIEGKLLDGSTVKTSEREYLFRVCTTAGCAASPCL